MSRAQPAEAPIPRWLRFVLTSDRTGSAWYVGTGFFFAPDGSSVIQGGDTVSRSAYPDGTWGQDTIWLSSSNEQVPSRLASAVYWLGPQNAPD